MGGLVALHNREHIARFLRRRAGVHLTALAHLGDERWSETVWYGWLPDGELRQIAAIHLRPIVPTLMINPEPPDGSLGGEVIPFLRALLPLLPRRIAAHLPIGAEEIWHAGGYAVRRHGSYWRMLLADQNRLRAVVTDGVQTLSERDLNDLRALYTITLPDLTPDAEDLNRGRTTGVRVANRLVAVAGVKQWAPDQGVAALGNLATHPLQRRKGHASRATAALCALLVADGCETIGVDVRANNVPALAMYERLGFKRILRFGAFELAVGDRSS